MHDEGDEYERIIPTGLKNLFPVFIEDAKNAVKIAKAYTGKSGVVSFTNAFNGRTNMCLGLTWMDHYKDGFGPFPSDIYHVPFPVFHHETSTEKALESLNNLFKSLDQTSSEVVTEMCGIWNSILKPHTP